MCCDAAPTADAKQATLWVHHAEAIGNERAAPAKVNLAPIRWMPLGFYDIVKL